MKVIAIAAVTAGGKTTTVNEIKKQLFNVQTLHFDDYVFEGEYVRIAFIQMQKDILPSSDYVIDGTMSTEDIAKEIIDIIV